MSGWLNASHITQRGVTYFIVIAKPQRVASYYADGEVRDLAALKWLFRQRDGYYARQEIACARDEQAFMMNSGVFPPYAYYFTDRRTAYQFRFRFGDTRSPNPIEVERA